MDKIYYLLRTVRQLITFTSMDASNQPKEVSDFDNLDKYTDDELAKLCMDSPPLHVDPNIPTQVPVYVVSPTVLVKEGSPASTARLMELIRTQTSIPVPKVIRSVDSKWPSLLFMQYIPGTTLDKCWPQLSLWRKIWVAWKLRSYIRQLRRISLPQIDARVPGPIVDDVSRPEKCFNPAFGEFKVGPFNVYEDLIQWLNERCIVALHFNPFPDVWPLQADAPLVVTHGDLIPRNIILGDDGQLWLIDWDMSGVYPIWFEYATMQRSAVREFNTSTKVPPSWFRLIRFVCGVYPIEYRFIEMITFAVAEYFFIPVQDVIQLAEDATRSPEAIHTCT